MRHARAADPLEPIASVASLGPVCKQHGQGAGIPLGARDERLVHSPPSLPTYAFTRPFLRMMLAYAAPSLVATTAYACRARS